MEHVEQQREANTHGDHQDSDCALEIINRIIECDFLRGQHDRSSHEGCGAPKIISMSNELLNISERNLPRNSNGWKREQEGPNQDAIFQLIDVLWACFSRKEELAD